MLRTQMLWGKHTDVYLGQLSCERGTLERLASLHLGSQRCFSSDRIGLIYPTPELRVSFLGMCYPSHLQGKAGIWISSTALTVLTVLPWFHVGGILGEL